MHQSQETTEGVRVLTLMAVFNGSERLPISTVIHRGQLILEIIFMGITDKQVETSSLLVHISTDPDRGCAEPDAEPDGEAGDQAMTQIKWGRAEGKDMHRFILSSLLTFTLILHLEYWST